MEVCAGFELIAIEKAAALGHDVLEISKRREAQMIRHMRHGSPPRLRLLQLILRPDRRESLPTPSAGVRMTVNLQASAGGIGPEAARCRRRAIATGRWGGRCSRRGGKSEGRPGGMPTGLISPRRTPLRACRRSAKDWASSSATAPAARLCQIERDK